MTDPFFPVPVPGPLHADGSCSEECPYLRTWPEGGKILRDCVSEYSLESCVPKLYPSHKCYAARKKEQAND